MDRHTWKEDVKSLDMRFYIATFLGENGETDLEVYYGLPIYDIIKKVPEERTEIQLENGLAVHDADWHPIAEQVRQTTIPFNRQNVKKNDLFLDLFRTTVKPGSYQVAIHARPENTNLLATSYKLQINIPNYSTNELTLSDILLASSITPTDKIGKFVRNGLQIVPNPLRVFSVEKQIYIYFEIYNLAPDAIGNTAFTVDYTIQKVGSKKLLGLFKRGKKTALTIQSDHEGSASFSPEYIAFDVSKLQKGEYIFAVKVTDKNAGKSAQKENLLILD
jgi:hypothetical protein